MKEMSQRKKYLKPEWSKEEMFERFAMACDKFTPPTPPSCVTPNRS
jgi:hypothetical protein